MKKMINLIKEVPSWEKAVIVVLFIIPIPLTTETYLIGRTIVVKIKNKSKKRNESNKDLFFLCTLREKYIVYNRNKKFLGGFTMEKMKWTALEKLIKSKQRQERVNIILGAFAIVAGTVIVAQSIHEVYMED